MSPVGVYSINLASGASTLISTDSTGKPLPDASDYNSTTFVSTDRDTLIWSNSGNDVAFSLGSNRNNSTGLVELHTYVRNMKTGVVKPTTSPALSAPKEQHSPAHAAHRLQP